MKPEHERAWEIGKKLREMDERAERNFGKTEDARQLAMQGLADALEACLESAMPNLKEHPTMCKAWDKARAALDATRKAGFIK